MSDSDLPVQRIADLRDGGLARVSGRIRPTSDRMLVAPLSDRVCVYWEVNQALGARDDPESSEGMPFWLEDDSGRVLIQTTSVAVAARAQAQSKAIAVVDADINQVAERIRQIKDERRQAGGQTAAKLRAEHQRLKELATLLCAIRAHARGRVHIAGTRSRQRAHIRKKAPEFEGEAVDLIDERFEVVLCTDDELEVSGLCVMDLLPAGVAHRGGYRDSPTCLQIRAPDGGRLEICGLGEAARVVDASRAARVEPSRGVLRRLLGFFWR